MSVLQSPDLFANIIPEERHLMHHFTAQHLEFVCEAREHIAFDAQPGTAIRGGFYHALIRLFSPNEPIPGVPLDPVRALLAEQNEANARGRDLPRAFTIEPPLAYTEVATGERFQFGLSLFGAAINLMPYLVRAAPEVGNSGVGKGRGRFNLIRINEVSPLNEARRVLMYHKRMGLPRLFVNHWRTVEEAQMRQAEHITLHFHTPMRLVEGGHLVRTPKLGTLLRRLLERAQTLVEHDEADKSRSSQTDLPGVYIHPPAHWKAEWQRMGELGDALDADSQIYDHTRWLDVNSYSKARQHTSPIGGFVGEARWKMPPRDLLVWLLWGQSLHVGKNAVKGDGYFSVE